MALFDPLLNQIRSLSNDDLQSLYRRVWLRLQRAFRQGLGHWVLGIFLLAIAFGCIRAWLEIDARHDDRVLDRIDALLSTEHMPKMERNVGLTSAVLMPINHSNSREMRECPRDNPQCTAVLALHANFKALARLALASSPAREPKAPDNSTSLLEFAEWIPPSEWSTLREDALRVVDTVRRGVKLPAGFPAENCRGPVDYSQRRWAWGQQGCLSEGRHTLSHLYIPSLAYESHTSDRTRPKLDRLTTAAWISELLEPSIATVAARSAPSINEDELRLVQAYFISPDSLLRIWSVDPIADAIGDANGFWAAQHYFRVFLSENAPPAYESPAYLDFGGYGVITTRCSPIDLPVRVDSAATVVRHELIGVFCTDVKLAERSVMSAIADSPFFDVYRISLPDEIQQAKDISINRVEPPKQFASTETEIDRDALKAKLLALRRAGALSTSDVEPIELGSDEKAYFVPMAHNSRQPTRAFIVVPTTPKAPLTTPLMWSAVATSSLGAVFVAASITRTRRAREYADRLAVLNNLPIGVIEANSEEDVVLANDRAEEILLRSLPKAHSAAIRVNFRRDLIEDLVVVEEQDDIRRARKYEQAVQERRRSDEHSSYYACLRNTNWSSWIRVTAVPILSHGVDLGGRAGNGQLPTTFGIFDRVDVVRCEELRELVSSEGALFKEDER